MRRRLLAIPLDEIQKHFEKNSRQDVKIVAPGILSEELFRILKTRGKPAKPEEALEDNLWKHSGPNEPNYLCESADFVDFSLPQYVQGPFAISFANESAEQDEHYHKRHFEIYFSEHSIGAQFRCLEDSKHRAITLGNGGAFVLAPGVIHKMCLAGVTIVIEIPSVEKDKENARL